MIFVQLATIPERASILPRVIASLVGQVDRVHLAMAIPSIDDDIVARAHALPDYLIDPKIFVTFHDNSLQDGVRWINAPQDPGHYVFVCDDDIEYPSDYVTKMIAHSWTFRDQAIISCMGKKLRPRPVPNYFQSESPCLKTFEHVQNYYSVEIPGACAMLYHTNRIKIDLKDIESPNSDLCTAVIAKRRGVKCFVVPHAADWLTNLMPFLPAGSPNMFDQYKVDDSNLTKYINENL